MKSYLIVIIIGYLFGCLQWSYFLSKGIFKTDIRTLGGGNAGASNTVVSLGWKWGVLVALLDILKAIVSIALVRYLFKLAIIEGGIQHLYLNGLFVILGHDFPFFMGFKGGKGTASLLGMTIAIDYRLGALGFLVIFMVAVLTDYIALGTLSLVTFFILGTIYLKFGFIPVIITIIIASLSFYHHIPNLKAIKNKEEKGLREALRKRSKSKI